MMPQWPVQQVENGVPADPSGVLLVPRKIAIKISRTPFGPFSSGSDIFGGSRKLIFAKKLPVRAGKIIIGLAISSRGAPEIWHLSSAKVWTWPP